jgi:hypothetical protein
MDSKIMIRKIKYYSLLTVLICLFIFSNSYSQDETSNSHHHIDDSTMMHRQQMIHSESHMVMPFDMNKVTHYFIKNDSGGVLIIKIKDINDTVQVMLVREHLKKEYQLFSKGDFTDPQMLHGKNMPGLKVLSKSKDKYKVKFEELPEGADLNFISEDTKVINAIHQWFDAQLKDHGNDAKSKLN